MTWKELCHRVRKLDRLYLVADRASHEAHQQRDTPFWHRLRRKAGRYWRKYRKLRDTPFTLPED